MKKMKVNDQDIRIELNKLGIETQNRFWEVRGINPGKVRELELMTNKKYDALYERILEEIKDQGKEVLEQHKLSINREERWINAMRMGGIAQARVGMLEWLKCHCHAIHHASCEGRDAVFSGVHATNSWDAADPNKAHPMVEVNGPGAGATSNANAKVSFKFSFIPYSDGKYCINPTVMMSGHWLLWTWGTTCVDSPPSSGELKVVLRVRVDQLSSTIKEQEREILRKDSSTGSLMSGWNYNSVIDGGASIVALLEGGHEAVVFVECELSASINNGGKAVVDMSTNSNYYYWVKHIHWGVRHCPLEELFVSRLAIEGT